MRQTPFSLQVLPSLLGAPEGTETQLGDAEEFLRLAFGSMSPTQQTEFLDSSEVTEFIAREGTQKEDCP